MNKEIRVRFAPSPTGYLHVGGLRTALYNYLFAKRNGGKFILRIEDTDRNRFVEGAVENLIETLKWAGLDYDEGPGKDGGFGPYIQSERLEIYRDYVELLLKAKKAYYCFCNDERLTQVREELKAKGEQPRYDKHCLHLSEAEIAAKLANGEKYVIRMNVVPGDRVIVKDHIRGIVEFSTDVIDDQVLLKSDGFPTYHLANVVDDHLMQISHVIRGEEWLPSTPKHVLLYQAFGWEVPEFAHLPLLLNADKSKLSKRQGDVAVEDYRNKGYLKESLVNFVAFLGWNPGDEQELFSLDELVAAFTLDRVNKSGAVFNIEKLDWLNQQHVMRSSGEHLLAILKEEYARANKEINQSDEYLLRVIEAMRERVVFVKEILSNGAYFFEDVVEYDPTQVAKAWTPEAIEKVKALMTAFENLKSDDKEAFEVALRESATAMGVKAGALIHPVRLAVTGVSGGPGLFDILSILGKTKVLNRLNAAIENIKI